MAEAEIVGALAECLEALRQGEEQVEACLERHTIHRAELEALLEVVLLIPRLSPEVAPASRFRDAARRMILAHPDGGARQPNGAGWQPPHFP